MDKQDRKQSSGIALAHGVTAGVLIIAYWLLLRVTGLAFRLLDLRHVSVLILFYLTYRAIKKISDSGSDSLRHMEGFGISMYVAAIAYGISSLFLFAYLYADKAFMSFLVQNGPFGRYLDPMNVAFWELSEGLGMQIVFGLIVMELFKALNRNNDSPAA